MKKDKLDEMRSKLKLDGLEESKKRDMFNRFVQAGGQVVDLNKANKTAQTADGKAKEPELKRYPEKESIRKEEVYEASKLVQQKKVLDLSPQNQKNNPVNKWIGRFSSKLGCVFGGIIQMNGRDYKSSFKDLIITQYQNNLLGLKMILASLLYQDKVVVNEIKKRFFMDTTFPYYFELIYRLDNLYNDDLFKQLTIIKHSAESVRDSKKLFLEIFKAVFIMQPYYFSLKTGVEKALIAEKDIRKLDSDMAYNNLRKLNGYIDFIFTKLYPKVFLLVDYYYKYDTKYKNTTFREYLSLRDEDWIGYYTEQWKVELVSARNEKEEQKKSEEKVNFPEDIANEVKEMEIGTEHKDPIKHGLSMIEQNVHFRQILNTYIEKKDIRALFSIKDKVFLTYCLLEFFDKEFSFIFSSNKVDFNLVFVEGKRVDMKRDLADTHYKISGIFERVSEYTKVLRDIRKLDNDTYANVHERSARSNQFSLQRSQISRTMRKDAKEFSEEFSKKFLMILSDYSRDKKIIQNPDNLLEFDKKINGERYLDGKRVVQAIEDAYCFTSVMNYLLVDGDLGGFSLLLEKPVYLKIDFIEE